MNEKEIIENEINRVIQENKIIELKKVAEEKSNQIVSDIFYSFIDISKYTNVSLSRVYLKLDSKLDNLYKKEVSLDELSWEIFLNHIYRFIPQGTTQAYVIISKMREATEDYSIVYEGSVGSIYKLLFEGIPLGNGGDFTIVSLNYDWLIYYYDDQERLCYISESV